MGTFDVVSKAEHYNRHPSGVEVKHVVRHLDFNLGNIFKYVVRRDGKEPVRSLKSAKFYLLDHLNHPESHPELSSVREKALRGLLRRYVDSESRTWDKLFYAAFTSLVFAPQSIEAHQEVLISLDALISLEELKSFQIPSVQLSADPPGLFRPQNERASDVA